MTQRANFDSTHQLYDTNSKKRLGVVSRAQKGTADIVTLPAAPKKKKKTTKQKGKKK